MFGTTFQIRFRGIYKTTYQFHEERTKDTLRKGKTLPCKIFDLI